MVEYCIQNGESVLFKPHPTDLSKFIMCNNNGMLFEMQCPAGTLFDAQLKICNHNYGSNGKITNEIRDSMAPKWLTKPKKPTKTTRKTTTTTDITIVDNSEYDEYSSEVLLCSEVAVDGYSCVPTDQCEGLLEVRGAGELTCKDKSQICCHESKEIKSDITIVDNTMARLNKCLNKDMMPYYDSEECYPLFEQGPCAENEWFVLDSKLNDTVLPYAHCETALDCEIFTLENEHEGM